MKIVVTPLYEEQLKEILDEGTAKDLEGVKKFKMYLDTVIINMQTKIQKYKKSIFFDDENIKDIEFQGLTIPFFIDEESESFVLLGIVLKEN